MVLRIWDLYLLYGEPILYCIALVILKRKYVSLCDAPMQTWLDFFSQIKKIKVPSQNLHFSVPTSQKEEGELNEDYLDNPHLIPLTHEIMEIYHQYKVADLFKETLLQQVTAE